MFLFFRKHGRRHGGRLYSDAEGEKDAVGGGKGKRDEDKRIPSLYDPSWLVSVENGYKVIISRNVNTIIQTY
jgi:hypothetical protein